MKVGFKHTERVNIHTQHKGWSNSYESGFMYYKARLDKLKDGSYAVRLKDGGVFVEYSVSDEINFKMAHFFDGKIITIEFNETDSRELVMRDLKPNMDWMFDYLVSGERKLDKKAQRFVADGIIKVYIFH